VSKSGGECGSREATLSDTTNAGGGSTNCANTGRAGAGAPDSAFTKLFSTCDWQPEDGCFVLWQHPWAGWCECSAAKSCGQEKQFPQNSATTTSAAMIELETFRILISLYMDCYDLRRIFRVILLVSPPSEHAQCPQGVPAAGLTDIFQLEKSLPRIAVLEQPAAIVGLGAFGDILACRADPR